MFILVTRRRAAIRFCAKPKEILGEQKQAKKKKIWVVLVSKITKLLRRTISSIFGFYGVLFMVVNTLIKKQGIAAFWCEDGFGRRLLCRHFFLAPSPPTALLCFYRKQERSNQRKEKRGLEREL